jgi:hypothetical protein
MVLRDEIFSSASGQSARPREMAYPGGFWDK